MSSAETNLSARSGDGTEQVLVSAGAPLPARAKIVFGTSRAGQESLELELLADGERLALARFALPRGLPANCWIPIEVSVSADGRVRAEARENLRRVRVDARFEPEGASARGYSV
ncbi:MAG: hypothetical protein AB7N76_36390 [Planctomycetota bacterium]